MSAPRRPVSPPPARRPPTAWIIGGVVALIVAIAAVVAITSSGDDDETAPAAEAPGAGEGAPGAGGDTDTDVSLATSGSTGSAPAAPAVAAAETGSVTVTGDVLPARTADGDPALGRTAPTLAGQSFDGSPQTIAPGKPTLVVFVAHWCPHCQREVPRLVEWSASGDVPDGLDVIAVATGTSDERDNYPPSEWLAEEGWPYPVLLDDERSTAAIALGIDAYPFFVLLDADGTVRFRDSGEIDTDELTEIVETALGG